MRHLLLRAAPSLALLLAAAAASAQPAAPDMLGPVGGVLPRQQNAAPGPLMGEAPGATVPNRDPFQLLANSVQVRRDLRLTDAQLARLQLAARNFRTQMQEFTAPRPGVSPDQARAAMAQHMTSNRAMVARELTPEQLGRLQQIILQVEGPCLAAVDHQVGRQLGLSGEQGRQVDLLCRTRVQQIRAEFKPPAPGSDPCEAAAGNRERIERIRAQTHEQILALLSPQQRTQLSRMQGAHLDLGPPPMPPGCSERHPPTPSQ